MKKVLIVIVSVVAIVVSLLLIVNVNQYSLEATVTERENNNIVIFEDTTGNLWAYEDIEHSYSIGDKVQLTWNDKGTEMKTDDEIIKVVAH